MHAGSLRESFYRHFLPQRMAASGVEVDWRSLPGPAACPGCEREAIQPGRRALVFRRGPRGTDRLIGQAFHGFECLALRAGQCAWEEQDRGSGRAEAYRLVERWATDQARLRRIPPGS
ncbi:MAG TPA: hypothetical protein VEY07_00400 [Thermoplasmata archaeon]|nr:hypothetical protein [Thermoplasmata archaeon]